RLLKRWQEIEENEVRFKEFRLDDAEIAIIAFGTAGRVSTTAVRQAREEGIKVGLFRPVTLAPFPKDEIAALAKRVKRILVVEMNTGMMLDDVNLCVQGQVPVEFYGRLGGVTPFPDEIYDEIVRISQNIDAPAPVNPRKDWVKRLETAIEGGR
ncbi:MAG: transketolase C-terminal domain-containing protein, partial [Anaerolineales bacterium]